jgi:site-specific DNA recombinase
MVKNSKRIVSFEELRGLRGVCYVRDSTLDQRDGFGPDIQRRNEERFAETYGIVLNTHYYTEFISGRIASKRHEFQKVLEDARLDKFDVLLVDHTSRFGRNQAECIQYKEELQQLGKIVIFVSQGIISGSDRDFLSERINETLDEQYSRNLSRYVSAGLAEKAEHGYHIGPTPLGYKSELNPGKHEIKVPDPARMPVLLTTLRDYASDKFSQREVANHLNSLGYRTRNGNLFTGSAVKDVLSNRFYEGKVIYHEGQPDEAIIDGCHVVSQEVRELWLKCQPIKERRLMFTRGQPRGPARHFPFSKVLKCQRCHQPYYGETICRSGKTSFRLTHERHNAGRDCNTWPRSQSLEALSDQFQERVLSYMELPDTWKSMILDATREDDSYQVDTKEIPRIQQALENLRKQHLWGDLTDKEYRQERVALERQKKLVEPPPPVHHMPNLERSAEILKSMRILWSHSGVNDQQREDFIQEAFKEITIDGKQITAIEPRSNYAPLFAAVVLNPKYGYRGAKSPPSPPETRASLG